MAGDQGCERIDEGTDFGGIRELGGDILQIAQQVRVTVLNAAGVGVVGGITVNDERPPGAVGSEDFADNGG